MLVRVWALVFPSSGSRRLTSSSLAWHPQMHTLLDQIKTWMAIFVVRELGRAGRAGGGEARRAAGRTRNPAREGDGSLAECLQSDSVGGWGGGSAPSPRFLSRCHLATAKPTPPTHP